MAFQEAFNKGAVDETAAMFVDDKVGRSRQVDNSKMSSSRLQI
jgi:hypothetical protein